MIARSGLRGLLPAVLTLALALAAAQAPARAADSLRIASFNIENLGPAKRDRPQVLAYLAQVIRKFDVVAVQEVSDVSGKAPAALLSAINAGGGHYRMLLSERTGRQADDKASQEQYAFYLDDDRVEVVDAGAHFDDSADDLFQREPFTAVLALKGTDLRLAVTTIHTAPTRAVAEIGALAVVYRAVLARYPGVASHLILGDFNAGCTYATPAKLDALEIRRPPFHWIVPDAADTNLNPNKACAYDRIVADSALFPRFERWGIADWFTDDGISDHWPVWVEFAAGAP
ncbi:deoxyribonuclease-1 [Tistlia consotensis]|uniref:Deoxyribonuclease-1 n=1 Tax=Tistlia consotensis USBA 355 TaxID=560819 RepID=A0A1Y6CQR3_9PROT|nr:endonuclease/exonuclease/phosphatase family protein [Tistlia consotensis]SMF82103.1 deoxyribonuclease-1 [Tistlia consotensis USBA 355]SNS25458.1 deoxyribonuclease-1 [Tistlia consotensis]